MLRGQTIATLAGFVVVVWICGAGTGDSRDGAAGGTCDVIRWTGDSSDAFLDPLNWDPELTPSSSTCPTFESEGNFAITLGTSLRINNFYVLQDGVVDFDLGSNVLLVPGQVVIGAGQDGDCDAPDFPSAELLLRHGACATTSPTEVGTKRCGSCSGIQLPDGSGHRIDEARLSLIDAHFTTDGLRIGLHDLPCGFFSQNMVTLDTQSSLHSSYVHVHLGTLTLNGGTVQTEYFEFRSPIGALLQMDAGAELETGDFIAYDGRAVVSGVGTEVAADSLSLGGLYSGGTHAIAGTGSMHILNGAILTSQSVQLGTATECAPGSDASHGILIVEGDGGQVNVTGAMSIGELVPNGTFCDPGFGQLEIRRGGQVESTSLDIVATGTVELTIDGDSLVTGGSIPIVVSTTCELSGELKLCWGQGPLPEVGAEVVLISAGAVTGAFFDEEVPAGVEIVYEATAVKAVVTAPQCLGDLVDAATFGCPGDGNVDAADLAFLLGEWGEHAGSMADLVTSATFAPPPDGHVNAADLAYLLGAWGTPGCP